MFSILTVNRQLKKALAALTKRLSAPWVERALITTAAFTGGLALSLSAAVHFDLLPQPEELAISPATPTVSAEPANNNPAKAPSKSEKGSNALKKNGRKNKADSADPALVATLGTAEIFGRSDSAQESETPDSVGVPVFDRDLILSDYDSRISKPFHIPADLKNRVGFWFDVYTKYDSNRRVIHHSKFPWIIYKVVDVSPIINSDKPKFRWMRNEKADKFVKEEMNKVRAAIRSVSLKSSLSGLNEYEQLVANALAKLDGSVQKNAARAVSDVRVQTGQRNFFQDGLEVSPRYIGTMEKIFREHRMPVELTRLPFVESSFNKHATSKVGASGIWQFIGQTGRKFMIVDESIDERRSPFKATEAAARLLKENHMILHRSWPLAVTAWNHGPGGVRKAMQAAQSRELGTIIARYSSKSFDFASSNFYSEFLAALHAEKYNREIFGEIEREAALDLHVVKLPRPVRAGEIIRMSGLSVDSFLMINPELKLAVKNNIALPTGFRIHVPQEARISLETLLALNRTREQKVSSEDRGRS